MSSLPSVDYQNWINKLSEEGYEPFVPKRVSFKDCSEAEIEESMSRFELIFRQVTLNPFVLEEPDEDFFFMGINLDTFRRYPSIDIISLINNFVKEGGLEHVSMRELIENDYCKLLRNIAYRKLHFKAYSEDAIRVKYYNRFMNMLDIVKVFRYPSYVYLAETWMKFIKEGRLAE
jgi:hypothetical protein